jgi:exopolysaccharide biosynthesis polyprenyl glycosylphosphotransferase
VDSRIRNSRHSERDRTSVLEDATNETTSGDRLRVVTSVGDISTVRELRDDVEVEAPSIAPDALEALDANNLGADLPNRSEARLRYQAAGLMLAGSDVLCLAASLFVSQLLSVGWNATIPVPLAVVAGASALWVIVFHSFGLYAPQHLSSPEVFRRVISATSVGIVLLAVITFGAHPALSRAWIGLTWFLTLVFELASRRVWNWWLFRLKTDGLLAYRTLIVGTNDDALRIASTMKDRSLGFIPFGFVATSMNGHRPDLTVLGNLDNIASTIRTYAIECLFVASTAVDIREMAELQRIARQMDIELRIAANLPKMLSNRVTVKPVGEVMTISLRPVHLTGGQATLKRTFDLLVGSVGLIVTAPLLGIIALAIKLTSPGPVLFRQERITSGSRVFTVYKFRTMVRDADKLLAAQGVDRTEAFFKLRAEPPVTTVGRLLRRLSLDELPQLWNIVKGDMSVVGPRPLPAEQVSANLELLGPRHEVRSGLTGWWQINGRSDVDPVEAVQMDLFYIENWSLGLDLYIFLKTLGCVLLRRGAY